MGVFWISLEKIVDFYTRVLGRSDRDVVKDGREIAFLNLDPREHHQVVFANSGKLRCEPRLTCRTSSSGSAAPVADFMLPTAEGSSTSSDTKCSIRLMKIRTLIFTREPISSHLHF